MECLVSCEPEFGFYCKCVAKSSGNVGRREGFILLGCCQSHQVGVAHRKVLFSYDKAVERYSLVKKVHL